MANVNNKKPSFTVKELADMIKEKYKGAEIKLINESDSAFILFIHNIMPYESEGIICVFYRSKALPFSKSFEFYTKNKYFAVPI